MKKTLNLWKMRNLTLKGRILLAKTLGFSKLQYVASIMQIPNIYIKEVETILFSFIWEGNKVGKVNRNILMIMVLEVRIWYM